MRSRALLAVVFSFLAPVSVAIAGDPLHFLIPIADDAPGTNRRLRFAFDNTRDVLLVSKPNGGVERFDMTSRTFLTPWSIGTMLRDIDVTPDGSRVLLAEGTTLQGAGRIRIGRVHDVNYETGVAVEHRWETDYIFGEGVGAQDVAITNNGKAFVTPHWNGVSGADYLREIDLTTGQVSIRDDVTFSNGTTRAGSGLGSGLDRSHLLLWESDTSAPAATIYSAATDSFTAPNHQYIYGSFSADGQRLAATEYFSSGPAQGRIADLTGQPLLDLPGTSLTYTFDPINPYVYYADRARGEFVTASALTGEILDTFRPSGQFFFDSSLHMEISADGQWAFVQAPHGVWVVQIPGPASGLVLAGLVLLGRRGQR